MKHNELLAKIESFNKVTTEGMERRALRAIVELHKPIIHALPDKTCWACQDLYPCPTIQVIDKEMQ